MEGPEPRDRSWSGSSNSWSIVDECSEVDDDGLEAHSGSEEEVFEEQVVGDSLATQSSDASASALLSFSTTTALEDDGSLLEELLSIHCPSPPVEEEMCMHQEQEAAEDDYASTTTTEIEEDELWEESEVEGLCLVSEQQILDENTAAKHFIEPARVTQSLDELSKRSEPLIHRLLDTMLSSSQKVDGGKISKAVKNWLLVSLFMSMVGLVAIYQILERSWMGVEQSGRLLHSQYLHLPSHLSYSPLQLSKLSEKVGLQSPPLSHSLEGGKEGKMLKSSHGFPESKGNAIGFKQTNIPLLKDEQINGVGDIESSTTLDLTDRKLEPSIRRLAGYLGRPPPPKRLFSSPSVDNTVVEGKFVGCKEGCTILSRKPSSISYSKSYPPRRVMEIQQVFPPPPASESSFFGNRKLVRDMKHVSSLQQCRLQLNDVKSAFANKNKVLQFVRFRKEKQQEMVIQQLKTQLAEAEAKLAASKPATCLAEHTEQVLANLTRSLRQKTSTFMQSVHSFANTTTSLSRFVQKTGKFSVKSLTRMSSWLRNQTKKIHQQPFVQQTQEQIKLLQSSWGDLPDFSIFKAVPKLMMDSLLQENWHNHMHSLVSSVSTALAPMFEHNFSLSDNNSLDEGEDSTLDAQYSTCLDDWEEDNYMNAPSDCSRFGLVEGGIHPLAPSPSTFLCAPSFAIAEALRASEQFGLKIGIKEANKYIGYLVNLPRKQCKNDSSSLLCEKCFWTGVCTQQVKCPLRRWQREQRVESADLLLSSPKLQVVFQQLEWVSKSLPPSWVLKVKNSQPTTYPPLSHSKENSRDWLVERSHWRQTLRQRRKLQLVEEAQINWLLARAQHRQQMREKQGKKKEGGSRPRRRPSAPYQWKKNSWKADADWLRVRAAQRSKLRKLGNAGM